MPHRIKNLNIEGELGDSYGITSLKNLSKINILIGANNSGKSRFMRQIFSNQKDRFYPSDIDIQLIQTEVTNFKNKLRDILGRVGQRDFSKKIEELDKWVLPISLESNKDYFSEPLKIIEYVSSARSSTTDPGLDIKRQPELIREINNLGKTFSARLKELTNGNVKYAFQKIYIPVLRGLRPFLRSSDLSSSEVNKVVGDSSNLYLTRTTKDFFPDSLKDFQITFTGLEMYDQVQGRLLGDLTQRESIREYEKFISENFFNKEVTLIPRLNSDVIYVKLGNEQEFPIYDLGDGIHQILIMTFPLFLHKGKDILLFIEEPELYLHPGLQRKFLEVLTNGTFENLQIFFTTHSNHFLDLTLDFDNISIFKFQKIIQEENSREVIPKFTITNAGCGDFNLLKILGVINSSVFLSNCTIWVEGITDRHYIRHYLNLYQKKQNAANGKKIFKEDIHFAFVEYGGSNITHWSFLEGDENPMNEKALCGPLFLIADRGKGKDKRNTILEEKLPGKYYRLDCLEIENLLSPDIIYALIKDYEGEIQIKKFRHENYKNKRLGAFIEDKLLNGNTKKKFKGDSGAIADKRDFADKAISHINKLKDLSPEAILLCEKLYKFIEENNPPSKDV